MTAETLEIRTEVVGGCQVVAAEGEIDVATAPQLQEALDAAALASNRLVVDFTDVTFLDSTTLGVLVKTHNAARQGAPELRVVASDPKILRIFEITGLDSVFPIFSSLTDATR